MAIYKDPRALAQSLTGSRIEPDLYSFTKESAQKAANEEGKPIGNFGHLVKDEESGEPLGVAGAGVRLPEQWKYNRDLKTEGLLRNFGYSDEQIANLSQEDISLARDFFGRFNNPKPKGGK